MWNWLKSLLNRYDAWCQSMGLTPENKRSCVPYKQEPSCKKVLKQEVK
ncbi:DUF5363 family protein [Vibrio sp. 10N.261.55.A7]|nr:DUF5363 family protein [Vibrio sp. 10N.261.55.A7]